MTKVYLTRDLGLAMISVSESSPLTFLKPVTGAFGNRDLVATEALLRLWPSAWGPV